MKDPIPMHRHDDFSDNGLLVKMVTSDDVDHHPVEYAHRDDYYIFGIIVSGNLCCDIDFNNHNICEGELQFIRPGQVHRFIGGEDFEGWMIMLESGLVDARCKLIFEEASINGSSTAASDHELEELKTLFPLIHKMANRDGNTPVVRNLVSAFIGIVAECFQRTCCERPQYNSRQTEIVVKLNSLLQTDLAVSHSPKFYADKLNISPVYLNEVVKNVTGFNMSNHIRNEIVVRAKRLLYHTDMPVKEIALSLGFEDNAYFSRLFTKATGKSPVRFRHEP